jgi:enamine deaminase RidA (YjgF/YER057c/UK114 family)
MLKRIWSHSVARMAGVTRRWRDGREEEKAGYSRAVRRFGHIAVSGTTAEGAGTYEQTLAALTRALDGVRALGGSAEDVIRTRIYLTPNADWEAASRAHAEVLRGVAPANTMLHVAGLIGDGYLVEVEVDAEVAPDSGG